MQQSPKFKNALNEVLVDPEQSTMRLRTLEINILPQERLQAGIMGQWAGGSHSLTMLLVGIRLVDHSLAHDIL